MPRFLLPILLPVLAVASGPCWQASSAEPSAERVEFNRRIRPILSDNCFQCHGPDEAVREADLRLDDPLGAERVVQAGSPAASELYQRITHADADQRMPPSASGKTLTAAEIELLGRWIRQGGQYEPHWSLSTPRRPDAPRVSRPEWPRNRLDHFVLARMEQASLRPAPPAEAAVLLRRATLGLTGLPPTLHELDAFLADDSPDAYERAVARLLDSPRYGEHMARYWLDVARYADTNGYFTDDARVMWPWRDWVIQAFNRNMPFDQFTIEQLAGDLLPSPTREQLIATGFNRNHMTTHETGVIDEEYRVAYVSDRLETTATAWLGLTVGCAKCHDHKFDPISQRDYYRLFAFFNNIPEKGNSGKGGNAAPLLETPSPGYEARLQQLSEQAAAAERRLQDAEPQVSSEQRKWQQAVLAAPDGGDEALVVHCDLDSPGATTEAVNLAAGLLGSAAQLDGRSALTPKADVDFDRSDPFSYGAWVRLESGSPACVLSKNDDLNSMRGFDLMVRKGKAVVHLAHRWSGDAIQVVTQASVARNRWTHLMVSYDGSSKASGVTIYIDGRPQPVDIRQDSLTGTIRTGQPLRIGRRSTSAGLVGRIDDVRVYRRQVAAAEAAQLVTWQLLQAAARDTSAGQGSSLQSRLRERFLSSAAGPELRQLHDEASTARQRLAELQQSRPTTMVMREMQQPRQTHVLIRGQYDQLGEAVAPGTPDCLPALPPGAPANRLGLARWLVDSAHPLTARVIVNRLWRQHFGAGIVKSVEDFGSQGEWPSHLDLLDWLAVELIDSGWDVKHIQRLIVTSSTYRQSSRSTAGARGRDPENRLLARGPRFRLDAEVLRDSALSVSGLLAPAVGGPSVKPYQPPGLWRAVSYDGDLSYQRDRGAALYRRGLYTFWKRQSPPPDMLALDAPTRETCTARRPRTNTPLQALLLMNDTTYVEAARALAARVMTEVDGRAAERVRRMLRLATSRIPDSDEADVLLNVYRQQLQTYRHDPQAAARLLSVGDSPRPPSLDPAEHAAWTAVANLILNLDETLTQH